MKRYFAVLVAALALFAVSTVPSRAQFAVTPVTITGFVMQNAATATGNGTALGTGGGQYSTVVFDLEGTFSATVTFEVTNDGTHYSAIYMNSVGSTTLSTTATTAGLYWGQIQGIAGNIRARISTYASGSVSVTASATSAPFSSIAAVTAALTGAAANNAPLSGNPVTIAATDGTNAVIPWTASAANLVAANNGVHTLTVAAPGMWTSLLVPSTATLATATKAAGSTGVRHVCTSITATIACDSTAQTPIKVYLRDGATTAGTIIWAATLAAPVNGTGRIELTGLCIPGTAATAMCLEFSGAGVTGSQEVVTLGGYDTN